MTEATEDDIAAVIVAAQSSNSSICAAALQQKFVITRRSVNNHAAMVKALTNLTRFCQEATLYEMQHAADYSPYLDAMALLDAVGGVRHD